jgi:hypothetical protein
MAVAVVGLVAVTAAQMSARAFQAQAHTRYRAELDALRHQILEVLSCSNTFNVAYNANYVAGPPQSCAGTMTLIDKHAARIGTPVPGTNDTTIGAWTIRASCDQYRLNVQAARQSGGAFLADPLNGVALDWNNPNGILFGDFVGGAGPATAQYPSPCSTPNPPTLPAFQTISAPAVVPTSCSAFVNSAVVQCPAKYYLVQYGTDTVDVGNTAWGAPGTDYVLGCGIYDCECIESGNGFYARVRGEINSNLACHCSGTCARY